MVRKFPLVKEILVRRKMMSFRKRLRIIKLRRLRLMKNKLISLKLRMMKKFWKKIKKINLRFKMNSQRVPVYLVTNQLHLCSIRIPVIILVYLITNLLQLLPILRLLKILAYFKVSQSLSLFSISSHSVQFLIPTMQQTIKPICLPKAIPIS